MTVQELINALEAIDNKDMRISLKVGAELVGIANISEGRDAWDYNDVAIIEAKA